MIDRIIVENFKSLRRIDLTLGRMNLFVGANASGKSNFLDVLRVLQGIGERISQPSFRPSIRPPRRRTPICPGSASSAPRRSTTSGYGMAPGEPLFVLRENGREFPAAILSDGTLRFAALTAAFFQPDMPDLITIEEIENGIHASRARLGATPAGAAAQSVRGGEYAGRGYDAFGDVAGMAQRGGLPDDFRLQAGRGDGRVADLRAAGRAAFR